MIWFIPSLYYFSLFQIIDIYSFLDFSAGLKFLNILKDLEKITKLSRVYIPIIWETDYT